MSEALAKRSLPGLGAPWRFCFERLSAAEAQRWRAVLAESSQGRLALLADRPRDALLLQRLEQQLERALQWVQGQREEVDAALALGETGLRALQQIADGQDPAAADAANQVGTNELSARQLAEQASPVLRLLDATLFDALQDGASDVHFETDGSGLRVRYRVDGVLQDVKRLDGTAGAEQLVSRLKVMAELDIGERRLPQDGRFQLRVQGRLIDFRLSVMPSIHGEDAVLRVLDRSQIAAEGQLTLDALGFEPEIRQRLRALARQPHGMLLVTGPTGSGKTTTLYAAISEANEGVDKIITIEDPVEYQLPGVVQIPVNDKKGMGFARGLRSVLRHDPDRVMVGEIRDAETAQIAVQAALTGHLVFSTVHANSVFDVIGRFMHMGLDLYNVVSALNAVLGQRLMRINCSACAQPDPTAAAQAQALGLLMPADARPMRGLGCPQCRGSGYRGRRAVAELMLLDDGLRDLIASRAALGQIKAAARERGLCSLREAALARVWRGESTLEELDRVTLAQ